MTQRCAYVAISIVTYKADLELLKRCLQSLAVALDRIHRSVDMRSFVCLVSNDSSAAEVAAVQRCADEQLSTLPSAVEYVVVSGHGNIGYGAAQNLGFEQVESTFHLFLNPDVILDESSILESVQYLTNNGNAAMVVPQGYDGANRYACLAKREPSIIVLLLRGLSVPSAQSGFGKLVARYVYADLLPSAEPQKIENASGCFMFCRAEMFRCVGGFNERYFLYFEDYDLSQRIGAMGEIVEAPLVKISHMGGNTSHRGLRRIVYFFRSALVYFNEYGWRLF